MMDKQKTAAVFPIVTKKATEDIDIGQMIEKDSRDKKMAIYHRPAKGRAKEPEQMQCDEYCIKLGYPMSYGEYSALSDETRKMYIASILEYFPGISINSIAMMFDVTMNTMKKEFDRLNIAIPARTSRHLQNRYRTEIGKIKDLISDGSLPHNLVYKGDSSVDLKRISYDDFKKMDKDHQLAYINGVYNKYFRCLTIGDFSSLFECSYNTMHRIFNSLGIKFWTISKGISKSDNSKKIREKFRKEMLLEEEPVPTIERNDSCVVNSIDITVDIDTTDITKIIKSVGISGKVRIRVERV